MTNHEYLRFNDRVVNIKRDLKNKRLYPTEAKRDLIELGYGPDRAMELVEEWGKGLYRPGSTKAKELSPTKQAPTNTPWTPKAILIKAQK
jgi:hypothetical protein